MVERINGMGLAGIDAYKVDVEAAISQGLPAFDVVGLPDAAVKESRDRVRSSMKNCGFEFPLGHITVNLAPADIKKVGPLYDLPIFIALMKLSGQLAADTENAVFIGELSLSGEVHFVNGVLPMVIEAQKLGFRRMLWSQVDLQAASEDCDNCPYRAECGPVPMRLQA